MAAVTIGGRRVKIVDPDTFTLDEWKRAKDETGLRPVAFTLAIHELDPDAWRWLIRLTVARAGESLSEEELAGLVLANVANDGDSEPASPPSVTPGTASEPSGSGNTGSGSGVSGSETSSPETTRVSSGAPS